MVEDHPSTLRPLESFQSYLRVLVGIGLSPRLRRRVDPSDIVQQTLLEAHASKMRFRGKTVAQQAAWLRQILAHNLADASRDLATQKRAVARERSFEEMLVESSVRLAGLLEADQPSPSDQVAREEQLIRVAGALASLPPEEQAAIIARYVRGKTLAEVGQELGLSRKSAAVLIARAHRALRGKLRGLEKA